MSHPPGPSPLRDTLADLDDVVIEQSPTALCICEAPGGEILRYNAMAVHLWGQAPQPSQRWTGARRTWSARSGRSMGRGDATIQAVLAGGPAVHDHYAVLERNDGSLVPVRADVSPIQDAAGRLIGAISTFESTGGPISVGSPDDPGSSGHEESESVREPAGAAPSALAGVWDYDLATGRALRSVTHDQIFGYARPLPEWTLDTFVQHVASYQRDQIVAAFDECVRLGSATFDCCIERGDGLPAWIWSRGHVVRGGDGAPRRIVGAVMDITRRVQAEPLASPHNRRRDGFIATLAHELRQPLSAMLAAVELIDHVPDPAAAARATRVMRRQIGRMSRLVDDVVESARWARGKIALQKRKIDLREVIAEIVADVRTSAAARGVDLTADTDTEPVWIDADAQRVGQIFWNLLRNAVKCTGPGGRIWITSHRTTDRIVVTVHDTGIGIAASDLPGVFDLFSQVDSARPDGIGVGLSVVRDIAVLHGGSVEVRSPGIGQGSAFVLTLPLATDR